MAHIENSAELRVEHLLHSVKQLSPVELDEFTRKLTEWQQRQEAAIGKDVDPNASDATIVAFIRKNSQLPEKKNRRYWQLRHKREDETLSDNEMSEYEELIRQLETMNVKRLEALTILVQRWDKPVREIMAELGLYVSHFDEPQFSEASVQGVRSEIPRRGEG